MRIYYVACKCHRHHNPNNRILNDFETGKSEKVTSGTRTFVKDHQASLNHQLDASKGIEDSLP